MRVSTCEQTLGILYLKELLKNEASQLKDYTKIFELIINVEAHDNEMTASTKRIFFPSPQVLKYSQSSFFNENIKASLNEKNAEIKVVKKNGDIFNISTFEGLLNRSIELYKKNPSLSQNEQYKKIYEKNVSFLQNELSLFRAVWNHQYQKEIAIRGEMDKDGRNYYLNYKTTLFHQLDEKYKELNTERTNAQHNKCVLL